MLLTTIYRNTQAYRWVQQCPALIQVATTKKLNFSCYITTNSVSGVVSSNGGTIAHLMLDILPFPKQFAFLDMKILPIVEIHLENNQAMESMHCPF